MRLPTTAALRMLSGTAMVLAVSAALAIPAAADSRGTATGAFTFLSDTQTPITQVDGNRFVHEVASISYTGGLTGIVRRHRPARRSTAMDRSAAMGSKRASRARSAAGLGRSRRCSRCTDPPPGSRGSEKFVGAAGGLVGLHGGGPFDAGPAGNTYSYDYRFAPAQRNGR